MRDKEYQQLLDDTAAGLGVVGAQLAVYDGTDIMSFSTGHRDLELMLPVTSETLFQIGSTTKLFNAALIMSLVDSGDVDLDAPVREYIPDFRLADVDAQTRISLRQLLSMTSGMDNGPYYDYGRGDDALGRYVEGLAGIPQIFSPGSAYGYSNASTAVAGLAAACVMGKSWETLLAERIWEPLGLRHSAQFAEDLLQHPFALGYTRSKDGSTLQRTSSWSLPRSMGPAGGLACCSATDLIKFARMFLDGGKSASDDRILSLASIEMMHRPAVELPTRLFADEWCVGPYRKRWRDHYLYGHSGTNVSGSSMLLWCPQENMAIATLVNVPRQGYPLADAIFNVVLHQVFNITKPPSVTPDDVSPVQTDITRYVGRFESFGMTQVFTVKGDALVLSSSTTFAPDEDVSECELIPLGGNRFLPRSLTVSGNRNWDLAFWGNDARGRPTHLLQGIFPLRRTG